MIYKTYLVRQQTGTWDTIAQIDNSQKNGAIYFPHKRC